jgi:2-aminomuconate deaminase
MGPRQPGSDAIPGGPVCDPEGRPLPYDIAAQTRATLENLQRVLTEAGARLDQVVDITCFLIDMKRDFATFNKVYGEWLAEIGPTRTTLEVRALPTPIAVELKAIAWLGGQ